MIIVPRRPTQAGEFFDYLRTLHDLILQLIPLNAHNTRRTVTPRGTFTGAASEPAIGSSGSSTPVIAGQLGRVLVGEWHPGLQINAQNDFIVYTGTNAGVWTATEAQNPGGPEPGTGGYYVKTGEIFAPGLWM